ncbi:hypothetical protein AAIH46_21435, partial [Rhizobium sp. 0TCS1.26]|uniref:hypothetical protein n=1 Tax=Rhizobium sp. 0TCS1.26 TaxID=3142623 RepID=UPI003D291A65
MSNPKHASLHTLERLGFRHSKGMAKDIRAQQETGVLISKRDRLHRIQRQSLKTVRETTPTTFLFLLIFNCQKTDRKAKTRSRQNHQDQTVTRPSISISQSYMISFQE